MPDYCLKFQNGVLEVDFPTNHFRTIHPDWSKTYTYGHYCPPSQSFHAGNYPNQVPGAFHYPTWRRHGTSPTPPPRSTSAWAGAREATDSACENAGNAKGRHPKTPARNLERHPYQRVTDTPSTPEPSAVAMRIHGPAATGVYVTPLIAKVICPDLLPVV